MQNPDTTKYLIHARINVEGVVERPDVVGAIFGQTEGLLGDDLDLRELQKTGRIGRIEVKLRLKNGKVSGTIEIPSSLDKVETAILAAALETIDRIGPCVAKIEVEKVEDVRKSKRNQIIERAKEILTRLFDEGVPESQEITEEVKRAIRVENIVEWGPEKLPAGPDVDESDEIIIVEGRADVLNLLRYGIKNAIAIGGTNVPKSIAELCRNKKVTAFTDGDRGGELIIKELLEITDIDYIARAPEGKGVEELVQKEIMKALRQKVPLEQYRRHKKQKVAEREPNHFLNHIKELKETMKARLIDKEGNVAGEVDVKELRQTLKENNGSIMAIVFDGVITQGLLDIAAARGVQKIVGRKIGSVVKKPAGIEIITLDNLT
jgi:DNA primase